MVSPRKLTTLMYRGVFYGDVGRLTPRAEVGTATRQVGIEVRTAVDEFDRIETDVRPPSPLDGLIRIGPRTVLPRRGLHRAVRSVNEQTFYDPMAARTYDGTPELNPFARVSLDLLRRAGRAGYGKVEPLIAFGIDAAPHAKYLAVRKRLGGVLDGTGTNRLSTFCCVALAITGVKGNGRQGGVGINRNYGHNRDTEGRNEDPGSY
jgi:hypothetical protein